MPGAAGRVAVLAGMALAAEAFQITPRALPGTPGVATPHADAGYLSASAQKRRVLPRLSPLTNAEGGAPGLRTTAAACSRLRASAATSVEQQQEGSEGAVPACLSRNAGRAICATEVLAVQKQVQGLSDTSVETWLGVRGYSATDTEVMMAKLKDASQGQLELAPWDRDLVEADKMAGE